VLRRGWFHARTSPPMRAGKRDRGHTPHGIRSRVCFSLSNWLRDYLYITLAGNRRGVLNAHRDKFLTMVLGGLWHGANWTFVLWACGTALCCALNMRWASRVPRHGFACIVGC